MKIIIAAKLIVGLRLRAIKLMVIPFSSKKDPDHPKKMNIEMISVELVHDVSQKRNNINEK
jgi:hypothetical protein